MVREPLSESPAVTAATGATERLNTRAAGIIGLAVMCSRVLGSSASRYAPPCLAAVA